MELTEVENRASGDKTDFDWIQVIPWAKHMRKPD